MLRMRLRLMSQQREATHKTIGCTVVFSKPRVWYRATVPVTVTSSPFLGLVEEN